MVNIVVIVSEHRRQHNLKNRVYATKMGRPAGQPLGQIDRMEEGCCEEKKEKGSCDGD